MRRTLRLVPLAAVVLLLPAMAGTAGAAPAGPTMSQAVAPTAGKAIAPVGSGAGAPTTANVAALAAAAAGTSGAAIDAAATGPAATVSAATDSGAVDPAGAVGRTGVVGRTGAAGPAGATVRPALATTLVANFGGIADTGFPFPDATAAVGPDWIIETADLNLAVFSKDGVMQCGIGLGAFFHTSEFLLSPQVIYDNEAGRFAMAVGVQQSSASATPDLYLSVSDTSNPCGRWFSYHLTFSGNGWPAGTALLNPIIGQDTDAFLVSTVDLQPNGSNTYTVFAVLKSQVYANQVVSFPTFSVAGPTAPATAGGVPLASTFPQSYFVNAVPGTGYRVYQMTNAGTLTVTFSLKATVLDSFNAPSRFADEPGHPRAIYAFDGRLQAPAVTDGTGIWFTHDVDDAGFPTVAYGRIDIASNTVDRAVAFHSATSDDFNPSIGIGLAPSGGRYLYLNWAYTDTPAGVPLSNVVDTDLLPAGRPALSTRMGTGAVTVSSPGAVIGTFGQYSSVELDPSVPGNSCAVSAQEYAGATGWLTRLVRFGTC